MTRPADHHAHQDHESTPRPTPANPAASDASRADTAGAGGSESAPARGAPVARRAADLLAGPGDPLMPVVGDRRRPRGPEETPYTGLERRRGVGRRLADTLRAAEEGELTREQFLFVMAVDAFKRANSVTFPAWTDVLEIIRLLGYRKTGPSQLNLTCAEDWTEPADAPAGVRPKGFERRVGGGSARDAA